jgi:hypothetical protein
VRSIPQRATDAHDAGLYFFDTIAFDTIAFGAIAFGAIAFGAIAFGAIAFGAIAFGAIAFGAIRSGAIEFRAITAERRVIATVAVGVGAGGHVRQFACFCLIVKGGGSNFCAAKPGRGDNQIYGATSLGSERRQASR